MGTYRVSGWVRCDLSLFLFFFVSILFLAFRKAQWLLNSMLEK